MKKLLPKVKSIEAMLQYAALPYRRSADGDVEVMLITSRDTGRWIIPKGWPVPGLKPCDSAAREAREEGGLVGRIAATAIGRYRYDKRQANGTVMPCTVDVFALEVERQLRSWPEKAERRTRWVTTEEAADAVEEPDLRRMIRKLATLVA